MRYEIPMLGMGLLSHALVVVEQPALRALPPPAQLVLGVLPTALILVQPLLHERLSARATAGLSLGTSLLYLGWTLSLPVATLLGAVPVAQAVLSMLGYLLLLLPALCVSLLYVPAAVEEWRAFRTGK